MCTYYVGRHLRNAAKIVCKLKGRGATSGPVLGGGSNKDHETNMRIIVDVLDICGLYWQRGSETKKECNFFPSGNACDHVQM